MLSYALQVSVARYQKIMRVLRQRQPDLSVLAEQVHKPHNLSAVLRSCDAVGIGTVHAVNPTGGVPTFSTTSASAEKWVEVKVHDSLQDACSGIRQQRMQILAAHFSDHAIDYRDADYTKPSCILLGNERDGVTPEAAEMADAHIIIPMFGMVPSLNVSVASAVILFEAQRQRRSAGMYDAPRLPGDVIDHQAYLWLYPRDAERRLRRGLALPKLDREGNPIEQVGLG